MLKLKRSLATIIFLSLFSAASLVSCGKQAQQEEAASEVSGDSTEHPSDSTEHPGDSAKHDHPADTTKKQ